VALITAQDVAVQVGDVRDAGVTAGEITEPPQVTAVALDGAGRGVPIELQPGQVLVDGLGQRQTSHARTLPGNFHKS
jgi:hypothetical protein